jgi:WASH complex subunit 7
MPYEEISLLQLIKSDNKVLNKVLTVFMSLCSEISELKAEAEKKFFIQLIMYEERVSAKDLQEGEAQLQLGRILPLLQDLSSFVVRVYAVVKKVIQQLAALYAPELRGSLKKVMDGSGVHLQQVYEHLGDALAILLTLDTIIRHSRALHEHWTLYRRMMTTAVRGSAEKFGTTEEKLRPLEKQIIKLEGELLEGRIFVNCLIQPYDGEQVLVTAAQALADEFYYNIQTYFVHLEAYLGEVNETDQRIKFVGFCCLVALHYNLFKVVEKKFVRAIWDTYKKVPAIHLVGNIVFFPTEFLSHYLPGCDKLLDKKQKSGANTFPNQWLIGRAQNLARDAQSLYIQISSWMISMESFLPSANLNQDVTNKMSLFVDGMKFAYSICHLLRTLSGLHVALGVSMKKTGVIALCKLVELLKAVEHTFHRCAMTVAQSISQLIQHHSLLCIDIVGKAKQRLVAEKRYSDKRLDVLGALTLMQTCLNGPGTKQRLLVSKLALGVAMGMVSRQ